MEQLLITGFFKIRNIDLFLGDSFSVPHLSHRLLLWCFIKIFEIFLDCKCLPSKWLPRYACKLWIFMRLGGHLRVCLQTCTMCKAVGHIFDTCVVTHRPQCKHWPGKILSNYGKVRFINNFRKYAILNSCLFTQVPPLQKISFGTSKFWGWFIT